VQPWYGRVSVVSEMRRKKSVALKSFTPFCSGDCLRGVPISPPYHVEMTCTPVFLILLAPVLYIEMVVPTTSNYTELNLLLHPLPTLNIPSPASAGLRSPEEGIKLETKVGCDKLVLMRPV
jgi:hypothetical protein